jgi:hypothetical protein
MYVLLLPVWAMTTLTGMQLYLIKPDYDEQRMGRNWNEERFLWEDIDRPDSEEKYRRALYVSSALSWLCQECQGSSWSSCSQGGAFSPELLPSLPN